MPRIRSIKPEFWQDEKLSPLDPITRLVFLGLISMADDKGRLVDSVKMIDGFIFPFTNDSASAALDALTALGRLERGCTSSGQQVIQIVNWHHHQKIDKPNFSSALPALNPEDDPEPFDDVSPTRRRALSPAVREEVWRAAAGKCQECGRECKRAKADKYDSDPALGEIDHVVALADSGTDDPQNLRLLCLSCNRKKAGQALSTRNRRSVVEASSNDRRGLDDASTLHINDLRSTSTTDDQRSTTPTPQPPRARGARSTAVEVHTRNGRPSGARALPAVREKAQAALATWMEASHADGNADAVRGAAVTIAFAYWAARLKHTEALQDPKREQRIGARLRENRNNLSELLYAVDGARKDRNLMGENERGTKYDGIETIFRDRAQVERLAALGGYHEGTEHPQLLKLMQETS